MISGLGLGPYGELTTRAASIASTRNTGIFKPVVLPRKEPVMPAENPEVPSSGRPAFMEAPAYRGSDDDPLEDHRSGETFARVYANAVALPSMTKVKVGFPSGSVIVREKLLQHDSREPVLVTAMFKREPGFSPRTGDWEFFVIDRKLSRIKDRDTVGSCAACHVNAKETDWVYKTYIP